MRELAKLEGLHWIRILYAVGEPAAVLLQVASRIRPQQHATASTAFELIAEG
jgi:hypothetical protein